MTHDIPPFLGRQVIDRTRAIDAREQAHAVMLDASLLEFPVRLERDLFAIALPERPHQRNEFSQLIRRANRFERQMR